MNSLQIQNTKYIACISNTYFKYLYLKYFTTLLNRRSPTDGDNAYPTTDTFCHCPSMQIAVNILLRSVAQQILPSHRTTKDTVVISDVVRTGNACFYLFIRKITKLSRKTPFRTVASPGACGVFSTPQF